MSLICMRPYPSIAPNNAAATACAHAFSTSTSGIGGALGGAIGGWALGGLTTGIGAQLGATLGSVVPGVGTIIGAVGGSLLGGMFGGGEAHPASTFSTKLSLDGSTNNSIYDSKHMDDGTAKAIESGLSTYLQQQAKKYNIKYGEGLSFDDGYDPGAFGGGDGLAAREVLKYPTVESIVLVDLDKKMTEIFSKNDFLTQLNQQSLLSPKVKVFNQDAFVWIKDYIRSGQEKFDFVIVDFPDPL